MQATLNNTDSSQKLSEYFTSYRNLIFKTIRGFSLSTEDSQDIFHDVFLKAAENYDKLRDKKCVGGWLQTITRNLCLTHLRNNKASFSCDNVEIYVLDHAVIDGSTVEFADKRAEEIKLNLAKEQMFTIISGLGPSDRKSVAMLYYVHNMSTKTIAEELDMSQNTVLSHLKRFRSLLKTALLTLAEES